ncbi:hypothetical protein [Maribellus maritimus]|uniref:hypothetical protein n=1 Tax=Maribellus maritimus TaxID=2870838 RepID=UPI001EECD61C|nr:hypothetical protein [Maribellus maritimus]MCG6186523.1 hypothetical protein [Maribellus maritimus]
MKLKNLLLLFFIVPTMAFFSSCQDDDDDISNFGEVISGTYSGTLKIFETGDSESGYVKLERASDTSVFLSLLYCEKLEVDIDENYELVIAVVDNNHYKLESGSNYLISGNIRDDELNLNVKIGNNTLIFDGSK